MASGSNKRQLAFFVAIGGVSTIAAGTAMVFLVEPPFIGLLVIATSFVEFLWAAHLWRSSL